MTHPAVVLDRFTPDDAAALREVDGDPEHRRRFGFPDGFVPSLEHARAVVARWEEERRAGVRIPFAVRDAATGALLGGCELHSMAGDEAEVSYWTHPRHRGRGVASAALRRVCAWAVARAGVRRLHLEADADNLPSRRVALRCGFREVGEAGGRVRYVLEAGDPSPGAGG
jgi:RimJ/RimL family protein N-acetyltransferase